MIKKFKFNTRKFYCTVRLTNIMLEVVVYLVARWRFDMFTFFAFNDMSRAVGHTGMFKIHIRGEKSAGFAVHISH